jgi:hypothetical protein
VTEHLRLREMCSERVFFCSAECATVGRFRRCASQIVTADGVEWELKDVKWYPVDPVAFTQAVATLLGMKLTEASRSGSLQLSPRNRTQVTIEFLHRTDGSVEPVHVHAVGALMAPDASPTSCRQALALNQVVGAVPKVEETSPFVEDLFRATLEDTRLGDGTSAVALFDQHTEVCAKGTTFGNETTSAQVIVEACSIGGWARV